MRLTKKYPGLVDRYYTMKPDKELLVPNGGELQNGMIVLLAQDVLRWPIENRQESDFVNFTDVLKTNRWCTVNDVNTDGYAVHFVGVYPDKTVARRTYPKDVAWLVKKDDVPEGERSRKDRGDREGNLRGARASDLEARLPRGGNRGSRQEGYDQACGGSDVSGVRKTYEVWSFWGGDSLAFSSDDPVEIVHWLRTHPVDERLYNVHPVGEGFIRDKKISHDFISIHRMAAANDIVKKAFEAGKPEGLAEELNDLFFGR